MYKPPPYHPRPRFQQIGTPGDHLKMGELPEHKPTDPRHPRDGPDIKVPDWLATAFTGLATAFTVIWVAALVIVAIAAMGFVLWGLLHLL
jgi:hypothetical protein